MGYKGPKMCLVDGISTANKTDGFQSRWFSNKFEELFAKWSFVPIFICQILSNVFIMKYMFFCFVLFLLFFRCDYGFHRSFFETCISFHLLHIRFYNYYTALTINTPRNARVAKARLTICNLRKY